MTDGVSFEELEYVNGARSNIQVQIDSKQNTLIEGSNITINNDVISASNGSDTVLAPGFISPFQNNDAPNGWLLCDGSAVSRSTYRALFESIGTTYGEGDGELTFNLPNYDSENVYILYEENYQSSATILSEISKNRLDYTDVEIPVVNNGILTIQRNSETLDTFSANSESNVTVDIHVPVNNIELVNGAEYITLNELEPYQKINNLVTSISANSTDDEYPSAKCMYDILGEIDVKLSHIISQDDESGSESGDESGNESL